jgi:DNA polymerase III sliding clamp (beta) subunit (PCNA family)
LTTLPNIEAEIRVSDQGIEIEGEGLQFRAASEPGGVFRCEQVIPQHPEENKIKLDNNTLAPLRHACEDAAKNGVAIQLRFGEFGFHISAESTPTWSKLANGPFPECHSAFEPRYLLDALEHCHLAATIEYGGELDPILIRGNNTEVFEVIMPRRL